MNESDWSRIEDLLEVVLDLPAAERAERLAAEWPDEPGLRARVLRIVAEDDGDEEFLAAPIGAPLRAGEVVGRYRLDRPLGQGGMGEVWLARRSDGAYEGEVAIKLLRHGLTSVQHRRRFRAERQVLSWLEHPGIARLVDGGVHVGGRPYLVMEYVRGTDLTTYLRGPGSRLTLEERLHLFARICEAVSHAHARGVVHRDLKPGNVLVNEEGAPRLVDFGIAKTFGNDDERETFELTLTGQRLYSPGYASPEQLRGGPVSAASDVYALGVVLYALLTGARPHEARTASAAELERLVCEVRPESASRRVLRPSWRRSVRGDLDWIVATALRKEPKRRYPTAAEMLDDLRRHLAGERVRARPDSAWYRIVSFSRRNRVLVASAVVLFLVLTVSLALIAGLLRDTRASEQEARAIAYAAHLQSAESALRAGAIQTARRQLQAADGELAGWEWRHLRQRLDRSLASATIPQGHGGYDTLDIAPDGQTLVASTRSGFVLHRASDLGRVFRHGTRVLPASAREPTGQATFHPDGRIVAIAHADGSIATYAVPDGALVAESTVDGEPACGVAFSPDGSWLAAASQSGTLSLHSSTDLRQRVRVSCATEIGKLSLRFHPTAPILATAGWDEAVRLWSVPELELIEVLEGHTKEVRDVEFLPDGRILTASFDGSIRVWVPGSGEEPRRYFPHRYSPTSIAVLHGTGHVLSGDDAGQILRWDPDSGQVVAALVGHEMSVTGLVSSPDGERVYSVSARESSLRSWAAETQDVRECEICEYTFDMDQVSDELALLQPSGEVLRLAWPDLAVLERQERLDSPLVGGGYVGGDGRALVIAEQDGDVWRRDLPSASVQRVARLDPGLRDLLVAGESGLAILLGRSKERDASALRVDMRARPATVAGVHCPLCELAGSDPGVDLAVASGPEEFLLLDGRGHLFRSGEGGTELASRLDVDPGSRRLNFSHAPDGGAIAVGDASGLLLWDLREDRQIWRQPQCPPHVRTTFLADGSRVFAGCDDGSVLVVDRRSGRVLLSLGGQDGPIRRLQMAPDGRTLLTISSAGSLRLWDVASDP